MESVLVSMSLETRSSIMSSDSALMGNPPPPNLPLTHTCHITTPDPCPSSVVLARFGLIGPYLSWTNISSFGSHGPSSQTVKIFGDCDLLTAPSLQMVMGSQTVAHGEGREHGSCTMSHVLDRKYTFHVYSIHNKHILNYFILINIKWKYLVFKSLLYLPSN